ncbi:unnamed protein product [Cylicocyclus nassatus]|uniref:Uncharacterized protein n=1 Tax=Cylicocyclus nassatus TaxID=53992 RepID=A0AA36H2D4_CYLNA|nr:unnamed protein product [Cylicocyclus nassatus]CAJ0602430.1 unnamed protein product [Cylicocyclus nassatus]
MKLLCIALVVAPVLTSLACPPKPPTKDRLLTEYIQTRLPGVKSDCWTVFFASKYAARGILQENGFEKVESRYDEHDKMFGLGPHSTESKINVPKTFLQRVKQANEKLQTSMVSKVAVKIGCSVGVPRTVCLLQY